MLDGERGVQELRRHDVTLNRVSGFSALRAKLGAEKKGFDNGV